MNLCGQSELKFHISTESCCYLVGIISPLITVEDVGDRQQGSCLPNTDEPHFDEDKT
jgi:hypothetical protein